MPTRHTDVLIVGAGFAGAATAFHLARERGGAPGSILLVEQEELPGAHASGRNASFLRQTEHEPTVRRTGAASRAAFLRHRERLDYQEVGSLLLGRREALEAMREPEIIESRYLSAAEVAERVPPVAGHAFEAALLTPGDGVLDTWALLNLYLEGAREGGAELLTKCEVLAAEGGPPYRVTTSRGIFETDVLVDAAGAWASPVAAMLGIDGPPLVPFKRHLFVLEDVGPIDPGWPFLWDVERGFYFRPESGGLLFSICDEEASRVLEETVRPGIEEELAEKILSHLPRLEGARIRRVWSCFRTKASDGRFVIGPDPTRQGFFWVAGLGGHGMTCSWEIGRLAARALLGDPPPPELDPRRFATAGERV